MKLICLYKQYIFFFSFLYIYFCIPCIYSIVLICVKSFQQHFSWKLETEYDKKHFPILNILNLFLDIALSISISVISSFQLLLVTNYSDQHSMDVSKQCRLEKKKNKLIRYVSINQGFCHSSFSSNSFFNYWNFQKDKYSK